MYNRDSIIKYGYKHNYSAGDVSKALIKGGYNPLGPREEGLYQAGRWGTTPVGRLKQDALDFASGINTIMTMGTDYLYNLGKAPSKTIGSTIDATGKYLGERGIGGLALDALSLIGSPYGITEQDIKTRGLGNVLRTAPGMMWAHPGFTTLDVGLPIMGRLPKHQVGDLLERVKAPESIKQFIPSTNKSKVNQAINSGKGIVSSTDRAMMRELSEATNMSKADMGQVARNLQAPTKGSWEGSAETLKATEKMRDIAKKYNESLVDLGVDKGKARTIAQAQYIMETINPTRNKPISVDTIYKTITGDKNLLAPQGFNNDAITELANKAGKLYDEGIITPLSHRATFLKDDRLPGLVTAEDRRLGSLADRRYGKATPEQLAPTLFKAYEDTAREIYDANLGRVSVDRIAKEIGRKENVNTLKEGGLLDDEVVISPRAYNNIIRQDFHTGDFTSTKKRINELTSTGLREELWDAYGDDLWVVKRNDLRPLRNMANSRFSNPFRPINSTWKTAQLITPKYFFENRLGNWSLNALEGVRLDDYLDATVGGKYNKIRPDRLKSDTSYYGVLGEEFQGTGSTQAFKQAVGTIYQGAKEVDPKKIAKGLFDLPSAPILALESQFEALDRYANFIRQAKRLSKETGESVENIIKRSSKDNELYDRLMGNVNRSLGDYIGRNWSIDPMTYEVMSTAFPFFKYPTQAVRTLAHQAMTRPLNFATNVTIPQRIGSQVWEEQKNKYSKYDLENVEGGLIDHIFPGKYGFAHLHQSDVNPLGAGSGLIASGLSDWQNINISPFFSLARIPNFQDRYGNVASSPKYYNAGGQTFVRNPRTGKPTRELANPDLGDRLSYFGSWLGNTYAPPVIAWNRYLGPTISGLAKKTWYPNYDTSLFGQIGEGKVPRGLQSIISGKTDRLGKDFPDVGLNQVGVRTIKVYPKQSASARSYKMAIKKYRRNQTMKKFKED